MPDNYTMVRIIRGFIFTLLLFVYIQPAEAAYFELRPSQVSMQLGESRDIELWLHTEGERTSAADAYVDFNPNAFNIETLTEGTIYQYISPSFTTGRVGFSGLRVGITNSFSGDGILGTFRLKAVKAGSNQFAFRCGASIKTNVSRVTRDDVTSTNIIDCPKSVNMNVTVTTLIGGTSTPAPTDICSLKSIGDADCNDKVDLQDFESWRKEYLGVLSTTTSDFNNDAIINYYDFETWRRNNF